MGSFSKTFFNQLNFIYASNATFMTYSDSVQCWHEGLHCHHVVSIRGAKLGKIQGGCRFDKGGGGYNFFFNF